MSARIRITVLVNGCNTIKLFVSFLVGQKREWGSSFCFLQHKRASQSCQAKTISLFTVVNNAQRIFVVDVLELETKNRENGSSWPFYYCHQQQKLNHFSGWKRLRSSSGFIRCFFRDPRTPVASKTLTSLLPDELCSVVYCSASSSGFLRCWCLCHVGTTFCYTARQGVSACSCFTPVFLREFPRAMG